jgi:hypothetical protein
MRNFELLRIKSKPYCMKRISIIVACFLLCIGSQLFAQGQLTTGPGGGNKKAAVSEQIGLIKITINYDRPGVKGREGKVWGTPVAHYGFTDLGFGTSKAAPWRAGANENTTISFSYPVKVEGKELPAGTYGLFMALGEQETTVIFSKNSTSWGSFYYNPAEDALSVTVKNQALDKSVEWLKYEFMDETENGVTIALLWEKRLIPFKVEADVHSAQIALFDNELRTTPGSSWQSFVQAANYCVQNNVALDKALVWAEQGISAPFIGQKNFQTLSAKAGVLLKMNKTAEADALMKEAVPLGNMNELHQYARTLLAAKRTKEAFEVFKANYDKNPNQFTTSVGLARAYSANGEYKKALELMKAALPQAPNPLNKSSVEAMIKKLEEGKDVN